MPGPFETKPLPAERAVMEVGTPSLEDQMKDAVAKSRERMRSIVDRMRKELLKTRLRQTAVAAYLAMGGSAALLRYREASRLASTHDVYELSGLAPDAVSEHLPSIEVMRATLERDLGREWLQGAVPIQAEDLQERTREERLARERIDQPAEVRGFEVIGLRNELIRNYLQEGFPRTWTSRAVIGDLRYTTEHIPMPESYHIHGFEAGHCTWSPGDQPSEIVITPEAQEQVGLENMLASTLTHEIGHANDVTNATTMDPRLRLELLYRLDRRVQSEDRLYFPYVEAIQNQDPQAQLRDRIVEYQAELIRAVFTARRSHPESEWRAEDVAGPMAWDYQTEPAAALQDVRIAVRLVRASDPNFDFGHAEQVREQGRSALLAERVARENRQVFAAVDDESLRQMVLRAFDLPNASVQKTYLLLNEGGRRDAMVAMGQRETGSSEEQDAVDHVMRFYEAERERLKQELTPNARAAFHAWQEVVRRLVDARGDVWSQVGTLSVQESYAAPESVNRFNQFFRGLNDMEKAQLRTVAERELRMTAVGEVPLPEALREEVEAYQVE